jgi:S-adenosylmethionine hydrolase
MSQSTPCITLTTDFGLADWFVGTMKGVIANRCGKAVVIDLTHGVAPGDIRAGAFALMAGCRFFPKNSVHVAVVDPGVGSGRPAIAVDARDGFFVGPDNGVLSWALRNEEVRAIHRLENAEYFHDVVSATFHGRDVFAPVAAEIANGVPVSHFGPPTDELVELAWPEVESGAGGLRGVVLYVDHFGNAITNLPHADLPERRGLRVLHGDVELGLTAVCYQAAGTGDPVAVPGSSGFLEIAVNGGSAAEDFGLAPGAVIDVRF